MVTTLLEVAGGALVVAGLFLVDVGLGVAAVGGCLFVASWAVSR